MSVKHNDSEYTCDLCGKVELSRVYPSGFSMVGYSAKRGGFEFHGFFDACEECTPKSWFRDPPMRIDDKGFIMKIFKSITRKKS